MASNRQVDLQQQRASVANRLKTLVNNDLKEICKAYGRLVSGTKSILQSRCLNELDEIVQSGDVRRFQEFSYRVANHGIAPSKGSPAADGFDSQALKFSASATSPVGRHSEQSLSRASSKPLTFRPNPFYELVETLLPFQILPEMRSNRYTIKAYLTIRPETAQELRNDQNLRIMMYCCAPSESRHSATISFPGQIEVKINDQDVKANFKGLKNKPGSTKPADITSFVRRFNGQQNSIQVTYALTSKDFAFTIHLDRYITPTQLTERIKKARVIPRKQVVDEMNRANADPDIAATSIRMSLKDPISTLRINLAVRSSFCKHNQCFDGQMFMELQDQAPQWACPVCNKIVTFESLCIDKYFEDILNNTPKSVQQVDIEPNGDWRIIKVAEDDDPYNGHVKSERASYDDDFDDDELVDLDTPPNEPEARSRFMGNSATEPGMSLPSPVAPVPTASTSSRGPSAAMGTSANRPSNKRPSSSVIDLTASDDEDDEDDQPPQPAKRQHVATNISYQGNAGSNSRDTTLPDRQISTHSTGYSNPNTSNSSPAPRLPSINQAVSQTSLAPPNNLFHSPSPRMGQALRSSPYPQGWQAQPGHQPGGNLLGSHSPVSLHPPAQLPQSSFDFSLDNGTGFGGTDNGSGNGSGNFGSSSNRELSGSSRYDTIVQQQQQLQQSQSWSMRESSWSQDYNGFSSQSSPG